MNRSKLFLAIAVSLLCGAALLSAARQKSSLEVPNDLVQQLITDINTNENEFRLSGADLEILHGNLKYDSHDLNGDGVQELFLYIDHSDWCGAGGNCSYWVYQKTEGGYKLLLEDKVLQVKDTVNNGYRDLSSETPMGFCDGTSHRLHVTPYKYDGIKYQAQKGQLECRALKPKEN